MWGSGYLFIYVDLIPSWSGSGFAIRIDVPDSGGPKSLRTFSTTGSMVLKQVENEVVVLIDIFYFPVIKKVMRKYLIEIARF